MHADTPNLNLLPLSNPHSPPASLPNVDPSTVSIRRTKPAVGARTTYGAFLLIQVVLFKRLIAHL